MTSQFLMMRSQRTRSDSGVLVWTRETIAISCAMLGAEIRGLGANSVIIAALTLLLAKILSPDMACISAKA